MHTLKASLSITLLGAASIGMAFFLVAPQYRTAAALESAAAVAQARHDNAITYYAAIVRALDGINTRQAAFQKVNDALPTGFSSAALINFLQQKSAESGITVQSVALPSKKALAASMAKTDAAREITFTVELMGTYGQLKNFLAALEKSGRLFEVESMIFSSDASTAANGLYTFRLKIKTYYE